MKRHIFFWCCIASFACLSSCHKSPNAKTSATAYDFSYTTNLFLGDTILFTGIAPAGATFLWNFGDGASSTDPAPVHIYTVIPCHNDSPNAYTSVLDKYMVTLTVTQGGTHSIVKYLQINPPVSRFIAAHSWKHFIYSGPHPGYDTTYLADTAFAINMVDTATFSIGGTVFQYNPFYGHYSAATGDFFFTPLSGTNLHGAYGGEMVDYNVANGNLFLLINLGSPAALGGIDDEYWQAR